jgi:hypothetical protein
MSALYVDLVARLRQDAAAGATKLLRVLNRPDARVTPVEPVETEILTWCTEAGRWHARVNRFLDRPGWEDGADLVGCASVTEALCALVEQLHQDIEDADSVAPLHVLHRLDEAVDGIAAHRALTMLTLEGLAASLDGLDAVAERPDDYYPAARADLTRLLGDVFRARRLRDAIRRDLSQFGGGAGTAEEEARGYFEARVAPELAHLWTEPAAGGAA